jgi:hypothetical protein
MNHNIIVRFPARPNHFSLTPYTTEDCDYSLTFFPVSLCTLSNRICHFFSSSTHKNSAAIVRFLDVYDHLHLLHFLLILPLLGPILLSVTPSTSQPFTITYAELLIPLFSFIFLLAESPAPVSQLLKLYVGRLCSVAICLHIDDAVRLSICKS